MGADNVAGTVRLKHCNPREERSSFVADGNDLGADVIHLAEIEMALNQMCLLEGPLVDALPAGSGLKVLEDFLVDAVAVHRKAPLDA